MTRIMIIFFALWVYGLIPVSAKSNAILSSLVSLSEFPKHDANMFEQELRKIFRTIKDVERYAPTDLPAGVDDPYFWAIGAVGFARIDNKDRPFLIGCNRIGRNVAKYLSQTNNTLKIRDRIAGVWPSPMKPFPEDAVARLDCFFAGSFKASNPQLKSLTEQLRKRFSNVDVQDQGTGIYKFPVASLTATDGEDDGRKRIDRVGVIVGTTTTDMSFTVWLLRP